MNEIKFKSVHNGLSSIAKKVYSCVPIAEPWTKAMITQEMRRNSQNTQACVIEGCLSGLVDSGLVVEKPRGSFVRAGIDASPASQKTAAALVGRIIPEASMTTTKKDNKEPQTLMQKLESVTVKLQAVALGIGLLMEEVEAIAIEVDDQANANNEEVAKLRQLKNLLKELG